MSSNKENNGGAPTDQKKPRKKTKRCHTNKKLGECAEVEPELQERIDLNLPIVAARHNVNIDGMALKFKNNLNRRGELARNVRGTLKRCDAQCRPLWRFLALRGAWDSMPLLLFPTVTKESPQCPAMDPQELCHFVRFKMNPADMPLLAGDQSDSQPLTDIFGRRVFCEGGWNAGKTMDVFGASVSSVHATHLHAGECMPSCPDCQENETTIANGCLRHRNNGKSMAHRKGNPAVAKDFPLNKQTLEDPNCQAKVSTQMDPGDVRNIRKAAIAAIPGLAGLKFCTVVLLAIELFLRADEAIKLKVGSLPPELFHRVGGIVKALGASISGKTDKDQLRWFMTFADDDFPDTCALRHLLICVFFSKVQGDSCLFPPDVDPHNEEVGNDGVCARNETHSQFLSGLKTLAKNGAFDCENRGEFRATIHVFREGAHCFRVLAEPAKNIDWVALRCDARHEREPDVFVCVRDALTLKQTIDFAADSDMRASDTRSVRFQTKCAAVKIIGKTSDPAGLTLAELAKQFVFSLGVGANPTIEAAPQAAMKPLDNNLERKRQQFQDSLNRHQQPMFSDLWNSMTAQQNAAMSEHCASTLQQQQQLAAAASSGPPKKKRKSTTTAEPPKEKVDLEFDDVVSRSKASKLKSIEEKIEACQAIDERVPSRDCELTDEAKKWAIQSLRPALRCLKNHHNNNLDGHCSAWNGRWLVRHPCNGKEGLQCVASS